MTYVSFFRNAAFTFQAYRRDHLHRPWRYPHSRDHYAIYSGNTVRVGIEAPSEVKIVREELMKLERNAGEGEIT